MPATCSVCVHDARPAIDDALVSGTSYRDIAARFGVTPSALTRHRRNHVSAALKAVVIDRQQSGALSALDRLEDLYSEAKTILQSLKDDGNASKSLVAVQVLAGVVEKIARITGELDDRPQVGIINIQSSEDWLVLRTVILRALSAHPDALRDVQAALEAHQ